MTAFYGTNEVVDMQIISKQEIQLEIFKPLSAVTQTNGFDWQNYIDLEGLMKNIIYVYIFAE